MGRSYSFGFPVTFCVVDEETTWFKEEGMKDSTYLQFENGHFLINLLIALAILAATAIACEWVIRRRERKQQESLG